MIIWLTIIESKSRGGSTPRSDVLRHLCGALLDDIFGYCFRFLYSFMIILRILK